MPPEITPSPADLLEERISDGILSRSEDYQKRKALYAAAKIAIPTVLRAAAAGNRQCQEAAKLMAPHLKYL